MNLPHNFKFMNNGVLSRIYPQGKYTQLSACHTQTCLDMLLTAVPMQSKCGSKNKQWVWGLFISRSHPHPHSVHYSIYMGVVFKPAVTIHFVPLGIKAPGAFLHFPKPRYISSLSCMWGFFILSASSWVSLLLPLYFCWSIYFSIRSGTNEYVHQWERDSLLLLLSLSRLRRCLHRSCFNMACGH